MMQAGSSALQIFQELFVRYPRLLSCQKDIGRAYSAIRAAMEHGGKLLTAGNGGSAADAEHIVGELMKSFLCERPICRPIADRLELEFGEPGRKLSKKLQGALPAIPLTSMPALTTAFANDVDASADFAQKVYGYGKAGDVFLGITASGNSANIAAAVMTARVMGIITIILTGQDGGRCAPMAEIAIRVPERETYKIQEYHLPIYHALCAMLEADFFTEDSRS